MTALLSLVLFLSGAAAVAFQTLWFRQTGLIVGNTVWASSIVLASFMAGLALGNALSAAWGDRLRRPLLAFVLAECAIGLAGVTIVTSAFWLPAWFAPWLRPVAEMPAALAILRLSIAFLLLFVPATAMGVTLPLLVRVLVEHRADYGVALGRLYGWNTLGAMFGALVGDGFAIAKFGVVGAALVAASCNLLAALGGITAARLARRTREATGSVAPAPAPVAFETSRAGTRALLAAAFLAGGIFLALEVVWFRFLVLFVHADTLAFSLMLAVILGGIGAGGVLASRWMAWDPRAPRFAGLLACACGAIVVASYALFRVAIKPMGMSHVGWIGDVLYLAVCLMLPSALATGVLFPLLGAAARGSAEAAARATGRFVLANTVGSAIGPLIGAFVLLPRLGMERSFLLLSAAYAGVALLAAGARLRARLVPALVGLGLALLSFPSGSMQDVYLAIAAKRMSFAGNEEVIATREGVTETIQYLRAHAHGEPLWYRLATNGYSMSTTSFSARRYMKLYVYLPVALNPEIRSSLLISFGVGSTAKALVDSPGMESIDIVDVSRDVLELSALTRRSPEDDPLRDPRVQVHIEDGRFFLQVTDRRFDLITGEPPPPKMAGIAYLYTREYFELIRERLTDRGIATYWLPMHLLRPGDAAAIVSAFCEVFTNCTLWNGMGWDWMLMGSRGELRAPSDAEFRRQWEDPVVGPELRALAIEQPEQLGALFMADAAGLRTRLAGALPLTDRHPLRISPFPASPETVAPEYLDWLSTDRARDAFATSAWIAKAWPPALRKATLPYFEYQGWFNDLMPAVRTTPVDATRLLERAHHLLTETTLESLPRLLLGGTDSDELRIVHELLQQGRRDPALDLRLGIDAMSRRRYAEAVAHFRASPGAGHPPHEALALALDGRHEDALAVIDRVQSLRPARTPTRDERAFWRWLSATFSLPDPYDRYASGR